MRVESNRALGSGSDVVECVQRHENEGQKREDALDERQDGSWKRGTDEKHDCPRFDPMFRACWLAAARFSSDWGLAGQQADPALSSTRGSLDSFTPPANHSADCIGGLVGSSRH